MTSFFITRLTVLLLATLPSFARADSSPLATALDSTNHLIQSVVTNSEQHELQILLTVLKNDDLETAARYQYSVDANHYFYPASTVKLPMALLAAEFVSQQPKVTLDTPYSFGNSNKKFTIRNDIRLIFAISDDDAFNRLYEIIGRDYVNHRLARLGYGTTRIAHRLAIKNADQGQRQQARFYPQKGALSIVGADQTVSQLKLEGTKKGRGYISDGQLISEPFDFGFKNYFPLQEQHQLLLDFIFSSDDSFDLGTTEREFLLKAMHQTPSAAGFDKSKYFDGYGKFFLYGDTKDSMPDHIKIYNKVGYAYGTLTDNAYIKDEKNNLSFVLSATLLVNQNEIFNDDNYEYESVGLPFLAQLGREIHMLLIERSLSSTNIDPGQE